MAAFSYGSIVLPIFFIVYFENMYLLLVLGCLFVFFKTWVWILLISPVGLCLWFVAFLFLCFLHSLCILVISSLSSIPFPHRCNHILINHLVPVQESTLLYKYLTRASLSQILLSCYQPVSLLLYYFWSHLWTLLTGFWI